MHAVNPPTAPSLPSAIKRRSVSSGNGGRRLQGRNMRAMNMERLTMGYHANMVVEIDMGAIQERLGGLMTRLHDRWILSSCLLRWRAETCQCRLEAQWHDSTLRAARHQAVAVSFLRLLLTERDVCACAKVLGAWWRATKRAQLKTAAVSHVRRTSSLHLELQASREARAEAFSEREKMCATASALLLKQHQRRMLLQHMRAWRMHVQLFAAQPTRLLLDALCVWRRYASHAARAKDVSAAVCICQQHRRALLYRGLARQAMLTWRACVLGLMLARLCGALYAYVYVYAYAYAYVYVYVYVYVYTYNIHHMILVPATPLSVCVCACVCVFMCVCVCVYVCVVSRSARDLQFLGNVAFSSCCLLSSVLVREHIL